MASLKRCKACTVVLPEEVVVTFKGITDLTVQGRFCAQTAASGSTLVPSCYLVEKAVLIFHVSSAYD